jgi:hypothetical protein
MATFQDLLTFTRGSTATYWNRLGVLATSAVDEPRLTHDPSTLTTSVTTIDFDALTKGDSVLIDLPGSDTFAVGKDISVTDSSNINRYLTAVVEFSNPGSVQVTVKTINGTGSGSSWTLIENLGLLIEEQRTNLLLWSEDFTNAVWNKVGATVSGNSAASPDGNVTADKLVEDTSNGLHALSFARPVVSGAQYTLSLFVRAAERDELGLIFGAAGFGSDTVDLFNLSSGTVVSNTSGGAKIENFGGGFFRISTTRTSTADTTSTFQLRLSNGGSTNYTGDGTSGIYIWGAQLEQGSAPSSYIKTENSEVTRASDQASRTLGSEFNPKEGTLYWEGVPSESTNINQVVFGVSDGTLNNRTLIRIDGFSGNLRAVSFRDANGSAVNENNVFTPGQKVKIALSYDQLGFQTAVNGMAQSRKTDVTGDVVAITAHLSVGPGSSQYVGVTGRATYEPRALSQAELEALTA